MKKSKSNLLCNSRLFGRLFLILRYSITEYLIMPYGILIDSATIAGISLDSIDNAVFNFLYNSHMIRCAVLQSFLLLLRKIFIQLQQSKKDSLQ